MLFGDESQREERGGSRTLGAGLDTTKGPSSGKEDKRSFNTSLRPEQRQIEPEIYMSSCTWSLRKQK